VPGAVRHGDVALWPGGERDSYRSWSQRDEAILAGRTGFIKLAIRSGVPIVPIATVGGPDAMPVLATGRRLAKAFQLDKVARLKMFPIALQAPWGVSPALLPEVPFPTKIRTAFGPPIEIGVAAGITGYLAAVDGPTAEGIQLAANALNASGGVDRHQLNVHVVDMASVAATGVTTVNQLLNQYNVNVIMTGSSSAGTAAETPIVTEEVVVGKREVNDTQHVSETTRKEQLRDTGTVVGSRTGSTGAGTTFDTDSRLADDGR